ncbi:MAG TPA: N-acetylmuramoyl-L-alanine amidase [Meiothermus sp.]|nr:N-acetylmuramoyl-L-alanine amidase [Meiothermus sp.]
MKRFLPAAVWGVVAGALAWAQLATPPLSAPRIGNHPGYTRVVLDLPPGVTYTLEPLGPALRITLPGQTVVPAITQVNLPELTGYALEQKGPNAVLTLLTPQGVGLGSGYKVSLLPAASGDGQRLVLDLSGGFVDLIPLETLPTFSFVKASGKRFAVVLDPGHGGPDPGAMGYVTEKVVTLDVAKRVASYLQAASVEVALTRSEDKAFSADKRSDLAARIALARGKNLYVSIHANAAPAAKAEEWCGLEVFYFGPAAKPFYPLAAPLRPNVPQIAQAATPTSPPTATPVTASMTPAAPPPIAPVSPPVGENTPSPASPLPFDPAAQGAPSAGLMSDVLDPDAQVVETPPPTPTAEGITPISPPPPPPTLPALLPAISASQRVSLSQGLAVKVMSYLLGSSTASNRGVRVADFYVNKFASVPSILVEIGYVTHPIEGMNLRNPDYLERLAYGIARGVLEYLENDYPAQ